MNRAKKIDAAEGLRIAQTRDDHRAPKTMAVCSAVAIIPISTAFDSRVLWKLKPPLLLIPNSAQSCSATGWPCTQKAW